MCVCAGAGGGFFSIWFHFHAHILLVSFRIGIFNSVGFKIERHPATYPMTLCDYYYVLVMFK